MKKSPLLLSLLAGVVLSAVPWLDAAQITCQGVLGNSGEQGSTLVRFGTALAGGMGIVWDAPTASLWARGGDGVLNRYALDGRQTATYPIPKTATPVGERMTRVGNRIVMAIAGKLYSLAIDAPCGTAPTPLNVRADLISAGSANGSIAVATVAPDHKTWQISLCNPETGVTSPLIPGPVLNLRALELLPNGDLVAHIPGGTLGDGHVNGTHELHLFRDGKEITDGWPLPSPGTNFEFLDNYWFGAAYNGTLRRFNTKLESDPGVVLGGGSGAFIGRVDSNQEVGTPWGPVKIWNGLYAVAGTFGVVHLLVWDDAKLQFSIIRRIGALQTCTGLALSRQGDVWYNSGMWHWNDPPDTPQREGIPGMIGAGQAVMLPNDHFVMPLYKRANVPTELGGDFTWHVAWSTILDEPEHPGGYNNGTAVYRDKANAQILLAIDSKGNTRTYRLDIYNGRATGISTAVTLETANPVAEWTALAMKDPDTLIGAGDGFVIEMARDGANWKETRRWNAAPDGPFGGKIYLTIDAGRLWISDTGNQRVLCFSMPDEKLVTSFGRKGEAGDDLLHLNAPEVIEARDNRVVVFDSGNQRIMKLFLSE